MMRVRCPYCSWMVLLRHNAMAAGIAQAEANKTTVHVEHCPKCRRTIKVSVKQMKRQLPKGYQLSTTESDLPSTPA